MPCWGYGSVSVRPLCSIVMCLLDVDVGGAVLAHRAELDEVALGRVLLDGVHRVDAAHDVVGLREHRAGAVHHGVGRRALLPEVHRAGGLERLEGGAEELVVADVAHEELDLVAGDLLPLAHALVDAPDGREGVEPELVVEGATAEVVHDGHLVPAVAEVKRRRPAAVPVAADDHHLLALARVLGVRAGAVGRVRGEDRGAQRASLRLGRGLGGRGEGGEANRAARAGGAPGGERLDRRLGGRAAADGRAGGRDRAW